MEKNIDYYMKIQNAHKTTSKKEYNLSRLNSKYNKHFSDSIDHETVLKNGIEQEMIIIKTNDDFTKKVQVRPQDEINMGDVIDWVNGKWLVISIDLDGKTFKRAKIKPCTFLLRWQNNKGEIQERWCVDKSSSQGSSLDENSTITTQDASLNLQVVLDDETKLLNTKNRFIYDLEGVNPPNTYKLTYRNIASDNYSMFGRGGLLNITLEMDEFNPSTDNLELMIADYFSPTIPSEPEIPNESGILYTSKIRCSNPNNIITVGSRARTLYPTFYDDDIVNETIVAVWEFIYPSGLESQIKVSPITGTNNISVQALDNNELIGKEFIATVSDGNGKYVSSITLSIESL